MAERGVAFEIPLDGAVELVPFEVERFAERPVLRPLDDVLPDLAAHLADLEREARARLAAERIPDDTIAIRRRVAYVRFVGQDTPLEIEVEDPRILRTQSAPAVPT